MDEPRYTLFRDEARIATGTRAELAARFDGDRRSGLRAFDDATGRPTDLDWDGLFRPRGRGRPKLGVVAREVTLLPRQWEWLAGQPGGPSASLRRIVDAARKAGGGDRRQAQDAAYHFMLDMAGDRPGYEEALRALYAGERARFDALTEAWPADVRDHARRLAEAAWAPQEAADA